MMKHIIIILVLAFGQVAYGQKVPLKAISNKLKAKQTITALDFGFKEYTIIKKGDTVNFYTFQKSTNIPTSIYLYLPGSDAENIYSYHKENDTAYWYNSLTSFDFSYIPENYLFVIIAKPGFSFVGNGNLKYIPQKYWDKTTLQDRVLRADITLSYVKKNILKKPENIVVFGYSEGFYVGAKLALINKSITHLGIGGGGANSDFYDFILMNLKSLHKGETNMDTILKDNQKILADIKDVMSNSNSNEFKYGYTYKRWATFSEPSLYNLVKLQIPIFQVHGANDESTPIESAYAVAAEFARLKKENLTFTVYPNSNHNLNEQLNNNKEKEHWNEMMISFFNWVKLKKKNEN